MRKGTMLVAALAACGTAIHVFGFLAGASGARLVGLIPYLLAFAALLVTRSAVVVSCAVAVPLLIDAVFLATLVAGTSGGVADLGLEWAMVHYAKLLVVFPVGLYVGVRLSEPESAGTPSSKELEQPRRE